MRARRTFEDIYCHSKKNRGFQYVELFKIYDNYIISMTIDIIKVVKHKKMNKDVTYIFIVQILVDTSLIFFHFAYHYSKFKHMDPSF